MNENFNIEWVQKVLNLKYVIYPSMVSERSLLVKRRWTQFYLSTRYF